MRRTAKLAAGLGGLALVAATVPAVWGGWEPTPNPTEIIDSEKSKTDLAIGASTNGDAIALWSEMSDNNTELKASVRHLGTWAAPQQLDVGPGHQAVNDAHVVIDQNGFATAVWIRRYEDSSKKLWFATRPAGGSWSAAAEVSTGVSAESLSVAMAPNGAVTAVWQSPSGLGVTAADKAAGATTWTLTQVSNSGGSPSVAAAPDNRTAIAWGTSGALLKVKVRTGTGSWADVSAETASVDRDVTAFVDGANEPRIGFGADGALHAAWWEYDDGVEPHLEQIRTSSRTTGGVWTVHPDPISGNATINHASGVAGDADGNVTVVWSNAMFVPGDVETRYYAATRVDGTWEPEYSLAGPDPVDGGSDPTLLLKSDGMFTVAWAHNSQAKANRRMADGDWLETAENLSAQGAGFVAAANDSNGEPMVAWTRFSNVGGFHYFVETRSYDSSEPPGDTTGPVTTMLKPNRPYYLAASVPIEWQAVDDLGTVSASKVRVRAAAWNTDYPADYTNLTAFVPDTSLSHLTEPGYTYCFQAQSQDEIPNTGEWSGDACTATPVDDRAPTRAGTWKKLSDAKFYRGTALKSIDKGATLTLDGAQGKRIALVVTKCPGCGKVSIKFAGDVLGTFTLAAQTAKNKVVIPVATLSDVTTGKLVVKVVSDNGKKVQIDGILVGRV